MSEIIKGLKRFIGKEVKIFLTNDFRYEGKVIETDNTIITILDKHKTPHKEISIPVQRINTIEVIK